MLMKNAVRGTLTAAAVIAGQQAFADFSLVTNVIGYRSDYGQLKFGNVGSAWLDINNDGYLDFLASGYSNISAVNIQELTVYKYNNPSFSKVQLTQLTGVSSAWDYCYGSYNAIVGADIEQDGMQEIYTCTEMRNSAGKRNFSMLFKWNGTAYTNIPGANGLPTNAAGTAAFGDFNNDGYNDALVLVNTSSSNLQFNIYTNNKTGNFGLFQTLVDYTPRPYSGGDINIHGGFIKTADLNGDGALDAIIDAWSTNEGNLKVFTNNGQGQLFLHNSAGLPSSLAFGNAVLGDMNNDGSPDVFLLGQLGDTSIGRVYLNSGYGVFSSFKNIAFGYVHGSADLADLNNDGYLDIVVSGVSLFTNTNRRAHVYFNDGTAGFTESGWVLPAAGGAGVSLGDYDNDGDYDLLLAGDTGTNLIYIYKNNLYSGSYANTAPTVPGISFPTNGTILNVPNTNITFQLSGSSDSRTPSNLLSYDISIRNIVGITNRMSGSCPQINGTYSRGIINSSGKYRFNINNEGIYYIKARSVDSGHMRSAWSAERGFSVLYNPKNLRSVRNGPVMSLYWTNMSAIADSVRVFRSINGGAYQLMAVLSKNTTNYNEYLYSTTIYSYKVSAYYSNTNVESSSDAVTFTNTYTYPAPNFTVTNLTRLNTVTYNAGMNWSMIPFVTKYVIQWSTNGSSWNHSTNYTYVNTNSTNNTELGLGVGRYYYRVGAVYNSVTNFGSSYLFNTANLAYPVPAAPDYKLSRITYGVFNADINWPMIPYVTRYLLEWSRNGTNWSDSTNYVYFLTNSTNNTEYGLDSGDYYYRVGAVFSSITNYGNPSYFNTSIIGYPAPVITSNTINKQALYWQIGLWWNPIEGVDSYIIEYSQDASNWMESSAFSYINTNSTNFNDSSVPEGTWYYRVGANYQYITNYSSISVFNTSTISVLDTIVGLNVSNINNHFHLGWEIRTIRAGSMLVYRSGIDGVFSNIAVLDKSTTSYFDPTVSPHAWYHYRIDAATYSGLLTNIAGDITNITSNWTVIAQSMVESNFTGNSAMNVPYAFFDERGQGRYIVSLAVTDDDSDALKDVILYYSTNGQDWAPGDIIKTTPFDYSPSYTIVWNTLPALYMNGPVKVRFRVFDGFEWNESGLFDAELVNGAQDSFGQALLPELCSDSSYRVSYLPLGTRVSIYNIKGIFMKSFIIDNSGTAEWDLTDQYGARAKVGYYIMTLENNGVNRKKVFFIAR